METFLFTVKDDTGRTLVGVTEAQSVKDVKAQFRTSDLFFISARPYDPHHFPKIGLDLDELLMFTRRLSHLIEAGVPILQSMQILWKQSEHRNVQIMTSYMHKKLEEGGSLQECFGFFPKIFPPMYLALIAVAEVGAGLVAILRKIGQYLEDQKKFVSRVKRAIWYPAFVLIFAFVVVIAMFVFVVPTFEKVIVRLNAEMPLLTQVLFNISGLFRNPYFVLAITALVAALGFSWKYIRRIRAIIFWIDTFKIKAPLVRMVLYPLLIGRFTRSLSLLLGSGVSVLMAIDVAKTTVVNVPIENAISDIRRQLMDGGSLYEAFKSTKIFPIIVYEMVGIGESSGKLPLLLENVSTHLEEEADYAMAKLLTYLEPLLIIFIGGIVLLVFLGIYLPIFSLQNVLRTL